MKIVYVLAVFASLLSGPSTLAQKNKNRPPKIISFLSSLETVVRCDEHYRGMSPCTAEKVSLKVTAFDPDRDRLRYRYEVTGGKILGKGQAVRWNLEDVANGQFQARVRVKDGKGGQSTATIVLTVVEGPHVELIPPPCPHVAVTCPSGLDVNRRAAFSANITPSESSNRVSYHWSVLNGKIVRGQDTSELEVEIDKAEESITATVRVGGYDPACFTEASCTTNIFSR